MKLLVFNVKYSENLGDGLLEMCLEQGLVAANADAKVETFDIAGRREFGGQRAGRAQALRLLEQLPVFARRAVVSLMLHRKLSRLRERFDRALKTADAVVIGGGNLFQDDDLNFPLKVGTVLDCVARSRKPLIIHAVGVSAHWSKPAAALFARLNKTNLKSVSVRDKVSLENWQAHFPTGPAAFIVPDPGVMVEDLTLPVARQSGADSSIPTIAICVTAPVILRRHASIKVSDITLQDAAEYVELVKIAVSQGYRVTLFSNGAQEDQALAEQVFAMLEMGGMTGNRLITLAVRPERPEELVMLLKPASVVIAHRLHACIAAYGLNIPAVGLDWDSKLASFFELTERSDYCLSGDQMTPQIVFERLVSAMESGIASSKRATIIKAAKSAVPSFGNIAARAPSEDSEKDMKREPKMALLSLQTAQDGSSL